MEDNNMNYEEQEQIKPRWVLGKLIIGIISLVLFPIIGLQSCAAGVYNAVAANNEASGSFGFIVGLNLMISGIIAIAARKSIKKAPWIVAAVLLWLNYFYGKVFRGSFSDLVIWGFLSFAIGVFYLFSIPRTKKGYAIVGAISAVYLLIALI